MISLSSRALLLLALTLAAGCGSQQTVSRSEAATDNLPIVPVLDSGHNETILLVSLDDGTVIMQTIHTRSDICFKRNSVSSTTCLTRGQPILDPGSQEIIGFEMIEEQIDLVPSTR